MVTLAASTAMPGIEVELREITEHLRQRGKFTSNSPFRFSYIYSVTIYLNRLQKNVLQLEIRIFISNPKRQFLRREQSHHRANASASTTPEKRLLRTFSWRENSVTSLLRFTAIHRNKMVEFQRRNCPGQVELEERRKKTKKLRKILKDSEDPA